MQESRHVFIKHALQAWWDAHPADNPAILELGLGTGLNALLTWEYAHLQAMEVNYVGVEAHPVPADIWQQLNYPEFLADKEEAKGALDAIHQAPWDREATQIGGLLKLKKREGKIEDLTLPEAYFDLVYFDAFAPNKQGELWELSVLEKMASVLKPGGFLTTYCAKGQFKRDLKTVGFAVETLPGAPGKAEMVRGIRN